MKRPDAFIITIVALFAALTSIYYYSHQTLGFFDENKEILAKIERGQSLRSLASKLKNLKAARNEIVVKNQRSVANVQASTTRVNEEVDLNFAQNNGADDIAKQYYLKTKRVCYEPGQEIDCLNIIDMAVTHFPESAWTAESLVLLVELLYRTKRLALARDVKGILKQNFSEVSNIKEKIAIIDRNFH